VSVIQYFDKLQTTLNPQLFTFAVHIAQWASLEDAISGTARLMHLTFGTLIGRPLMKKYCLSPPVLPKEASPFEMYLQYRQKLASWLL